MTRAWAESGSKIKSNTTRILRMLVVFHIIFFTRFVTLTRIMCTSGYIFV